MKKVKKAVVLLAGYGTRSLPFTKVLPKAMIPILNKPVIGYIIDELEKSDIEEVIFVVAKDCNGKILKEYFAPNKSYEKYLKGRNREESLKQLQDIKSNVKIRYVYNTKANGSGGALLSAKKYLKGQPFILMNGDDIFIGEHSDINSLIENYEKTGKNSFLALHLPESKYHLHGMCETVEKDGYFEVKRMVEKPKIGEVNGDIGAVGRYLLENDIFEMLRKTEKINGEIMMTYALQDYIKQNRLNAVIAKSTRVDAGNTMEVAEAGVTFALENDLYKDRMIEFLKDLNKKLKL